MLNNKVSDKNIDAIAEAIRALQIKTQDLTKDIVGLKSSVNELTTKNKALEQQLVLASISGRGNGPTT